MLGEEERKERMERVGRGNDLIRNGKRADVGVMGVMGVMGDGGRERREGGMRWDGVWMWVDVGGCGLGGPCLSGTGWYGLVWLGTGWYGLVWFGMVWYGGGRYSTEGYI